MTRFERRALRPPVFIRASDGKFYQDLVYQDDPRRRAWFIVFDSEEPAELVIREDHVKDMPPADLLRHRGFALCLKGIMSGRRLAHKRFFGADEVKDAVGHNAVSWFLVFKRGIPLPTPCKFDSCAEIFPFLPAVKDGVYFGVTP